MSLNEYMNVISLFVSLAAFVFLLDWLRTVTIKRKNAHVVPPIEKAEEVASDWERVYQPVDKFFTKSEFAFYSILQKACSDRCLVFSNVRLEDLVRVKYGVDRSLRFGSRNRIKSRHVDFVLVDKISGNILAAIELDGKSHFSKNQRTLDVIKDKIMGKVYGRRFHRVQVGSDFHAEVKRILDSM